MDPELKQLLNATYELAEENNKMLRAMRRSMRFQRILRIIYWVLIIGLSFGAYYFIQPYIGQLLDVYGGAKSSLDNVGSALKNLPN